MPTKKAPKKVDMKVHKNPMGAGFAQKDDKAAVEKTKEATPKVSDFEAKAKEVGSANLVSFAYKVLGNPMYGEYLDEARKIIADNK